MKYSITYCITNYKIIINPMKKCYFIMFIEKLRSVGCWGLSNEDLGSILGPRLKFFHEQSNPAHYPG